MSGSSQPLTLFWLRHDLRLEDNAGLSRALENGAPVLSLFIFDTHILDSLSDKADARVHFIHQSLHSLEKRLNQHNSSLLVYHGKPLECWKHLVERFSIKRVYANADYDPYAIKRDEQVKDFLKQNDIEFTLVKDSVIFEKNEILKADGDPYIVYTPYKNRWLDHLNDLVLQEHPSASRAGRFFKTSPFGLPELKEIGFRETEMIFDKPELDEDIIKTYHQTRDYPWIKNGTTRLGMHLRFGTISIRKCVKAGLKLNSIWLSELIWREFFKSILYHFPHVEKRAFREAYEEIEWRNDRDEFDRWCEGTTGYPIVDAGMRQLNQTGFMHNRVRMITAGFLCKHLLIDWRRGERYFAGKLLDYDLSANNGNWQWAAGTGCDAAPYFRIFNPELQTKKFDPRFKYIKEWVPEWNTADYPDPIVEHKYARERALHTYKSSIKK